VLSAVGKNSYGAVRQNLGRCIFCLRVTTLCRFQCGVAEGMHSTSAVLFFLVSLSAVRLCFRTNIRRCWLLLSPSVR